MKTRATWQMIAGVLCLIWVSTAILAQSEPNEDLAKLQGLLADGEHGTAIEQSRAMLATLESDGLGDSVLAADVLDVLVESLWRTGNAAEPETRELGLRALAIKQQAGSQQQAGVGKTQHHLAILSFFTGEYGKAQTLWESAIANREAALGSEHPDVAESMNGLANLLQMTGDFDEAKRLYAKAVEIRIAEFGEQDPRVGHTLNNLASLYNVTADYAAALPVAEQSLEIKRKAFEPGNPEIAVGLFNLADLLDRTGDQERARKLSEEGVKIFEDAYGAEHPDVASGLNNLADQLRRAGEYEEARPLFERALAIWEKTQGEDHANVALALNNLSSLEENLGHLTEARSLQERGVAIREKALGEEHPDLAESVQNLADLLTALQDNDQAAASYRRALKIREVAYGDKHPSVAESLNGLARIEARQGDVLAAAKDAIKSEQISREHLRLTGRTFAEEHALRYAATRTRGLDLAVTLAVSGDSAPKAELLDAVIRSRAVILDEMAERHRAGLDSEDPEVARLSADLAKARSKLANLTVRGPGDFGVEMYREFMAEAIKQKEQAERALGAASANFAQLQARSRQGLNEVQSNLPQNTALVSFVQYRHLPDAVKPQGKPHATEDTPLDDTPIPSYAALVLRAGVTTPAVVRLGAIEDIDVAVAAWKKEAAQGALNFRRSAEASEAAYRSVATELRDKVWTPLAQPLEGVERVFLVPDGAINLISFGALPAGESSYLVESGPVVHYLSAERDLIPTDRGASGHGLLALGGPDYDIAPQTGAIPAMQSSKEEQPVLETTTRSAGCATLQTLQFAPLPAAVAESEEILGIWAEALKSSAQAQPGQRLTGADATEAAFKKGAVGKRILHIATHGFFLGGDCAASAAGTRGFKIVKAEKKVAKPVLDTPVSPLLLSGLALAGANGRGEGLGADQEDGVLTAEEIAALNLNGVEWAVLSACDTGVGEIQAGEGVFGLRRAMQVAGVRTLILSLWPVDDEATRAFMGALYRGRLVEGLDSADSVRRAGLSVLERRRAAEESTHPFYWAAFVAAGDWR